MNEPPTDAPVRPQTGNVSPNDSADQAPDPPQNPLESSESEQIPANPNSTSASALTPQMPIPPRTSTDSPGAESGASGHGLVNDGVPATQIHSSNTFYGTPGYPSPQYNHGGPSSFRPGIVDERDNCDCTKRHVNPIRRFLGLPPPKHSCRSGATSPERKRSGGDNLLYPSLPVPRLPPQPSWAGAYGPGYPQLTPSTAPQHGWPQMYYQPPPQPAPYPLDPTTPLPWGIAPYSGDSQPYFWHSPPVPYPAQFSPTWATSAPMQGVSPPGFPYMNQSAPLEAYSPQSLRTKILEELRDHQSAKNLDGILVQSVYRYRNNATLLIQFNLAENIGAEGNTLMLYPPSRESQPADDMSRVESFTRPRAMLKANAERIFNQALFRAFLTDNASPSTSQAYFNIVDRPYANTQGNKWKGTGVVLEEKSFENLSLDRVVVLAFTISSRVSEHASVGLGYEIFLDAMWNGVDRCGAVGNTNIDSSLNNESLLNLLLRGFGGNLMEFSLDVWKIKQGHSNEQLKNANNELSEKLKELENRKAALLGQTSGEIVP